MSNSPGASLDQAFEALIERVVESTMASVRGEMARLAESAAASAAQAAAASAPPPPAASSTSPQDGRVAALHLAMSSILAPTSQTDIMAAALKSTAAASGTAALFVRRGDSFTTWRSEGLHAEQAAQLKSLAASAATAGAFKDMCDGARSVCYAASSAGWPAGMDALAAGSANICLLPILVAGKVVAAIAAAAGDSQDSVASQEVIVRVAGLSLETSGTRTAAPAPSPGQAQPQPAAAPAPPPAPAPAPAPEPVAAAPAADASRGSFVDVPVAASASTQPPPPDVESLPEPDKESHRKAHRFARVAVQDLLSYHKAKIAEGRNNRNLYDVLREDIEKTRENYQKKFAPTAAASFDYLHYEMVGKLAGNDPEVLGGNYPGPISA